MPETLLFLPDGNERRALSRARIGELTFRSCLSVAALRAGIGLNPEAVLCGPSSELIEDPNVLEMIDAHGIKLVIRCSLTRSVVCDLVSLSSRFPAFRVSLRTPFETGDLIRDLNCLIDEPDGGPIGVLTNRIANLVHPDAMRFALTALVLGRERTDVLGYATICGLAPRSLQASHQHFRLSGPHRLLAWGQACWMVWRMERYGWNPKRTALAGGFASASAMSAALTPVIGKSPATLARCDGVTVLTNLFESRMVQ